MQIQLNATGTHHLEVTERAFQTIRKYNLLHALAGSTGYVTENELDKLKLHIRALIASNTADTKDLLDLCIDVIYHDKMKAYGLKNLMDAYNAWEAAHPEAEADSSVAL